MSTLEQKDVDPRTGSTIKKMAIMRGLRFALPVLLLAVLFSLPVIVLAQSGGYNLSWWTVDGGGATFSTGDTYRLGGTIGQPDAGEHSGGDYTLYGGFWNRDFPSPLPPATPAAKRNSLPDTGFAPGRVTPLSAQPAEKAYTAMSDLWLEIPSLGLKMDIIGVPFVNGEWDVSWLGKQAGWLEGSAYPSWKGNSVLTGHVWNADNSAGPFRYANTLWWGDKIIIHLSRQQYIYEVRSVKQVAPNDVDALMKHEELPWLTLVSCKGYVESTGEYRARVLVRAVLVEVK
jgi:LPXTG-site transpeptidase (sortase) family protein